MKMTKKLIFAALAVAAVIGFASCQKEIGDINWQGGVLGSGDGNTTFKVKQTNDAKSTIRGFKQVGLLERATATCVMKQKNQSSSTEDGVVGFACCFTQNKDATKDNYKTYNFLVVGVRNTFAKRDTYVSFFYNIAEDKLSTQNFGCSEIKTQYDKDCVTPYEIVLLDWTDLSSSLKLVDGTLAVGVKLTEGSSGNVKIEWFKESELDTNDAAATAKPTASAIKTHEVTGSVVGRDETSTKGKICTYANIYAGKTLEASWDIYSISWSKDTTFSAEDDDFIEVGDVIFE